MARKRPTTGLRGLTRTELLRETNPATARLLSTADARAELRRRDRLTARPNRPAARNAPARRELEAREAATNLAAFNSPAARARAQRQRLQQDRAANTAPTTQPSIPAPRASSPTQARTSPT